MGTELLLTLVLCTGLMLATVPTAGWQLMRLNVVRLDGSWSLSRFRRELLSLRDHALNTALPVVLIGSLLFTILSVTFSLVAPLSTIVAVFTRFDSDFSIWRNDLQAVREEHLSFLLRIGFDSSTAHQLQQFLWRAWPVLALLAIVALYLSVRFFIGCCRRSAIGLLEGARHRRTLYASGDVARMQNRGEETA